MDLIQQSSGLVDRCGSDSPRAAIPKGAGANRVPLRSRGERPESSTWRERPSTIARWITHRAMQPDHYRQRPDQIRKPGSAVSRGSNGVGPRTSLARLTKRRRYEFVMKWGRNTSDEAGRHPIAPSIDSRHPRPTPQASRSTRASPRSAHPSSHCARATSPS